MSTKTDFIIEKASGEKEIFDIEKLRYSLERSGAQASTITLILEDISNWIYNGVTTKKIYSRAFSKLRKEKSIASGKYKLKQAIMELGSTGYPFEILVGEIFKRKGYQTEVGVIVDGHCVNHEMDVIATKEKGQHLVECKYAKDQGKHVSIQVPLYVRSRVDDIIKERRSQKEFNGFSFLGWIFTNTRFSSDSVTYGKCNGLKLVGWNYPLGNGLKDELERTKIFPVSILKTLTKKESKYIIDKGCVTCLQLLDQMDILHELSITARRVNKIAKELDEIIGHR